MSCTKVDLEDLITKVPLGIDDKIDQLTDSANELVNREIESKKQMHSFIREMWKKHKTSFSHGQLLYAYRKLCVENNIVYNKHYAELLQAKVGRGSSGVIVVSCMLSPYPGIDLVNEDEIYNLLKILDDNHVTLKTSYGKSDTMVNDVVTLLK